MNFKISLIDMAITRNEDLGMLNLNWEIFFHENKSQKVDFRHFLDPFGGFTLKTVLGIHDPRIS